VYRRRVGHETRKNFQLDLFLPDDGHYEYSGSPATSRSVRPSPSGTSWPGAEHRKRHSPSSRTASLSTACPPTTMRRTAPGSSSASSR
jgi:hypothetical protein